MFFTKSLRTKIILSALIPTILVLVGAAIIALFAYERAARDVVEERDTELARISAARLSEALSQHSLVLRTISAEADIRSMEPARLRSALESARNRLNVFDAGVVVYDGEGIAVSSQPFEPGRQGAGFPVPSELEIVGDTLRPAFSNVFMDEVSGEEVVMIAVPILGSGGELDGVLVGIATLRSSLLNVTYSKVLEITAGQSGFAYLVDRNGRVIYHRDSSQLGRRLTTIEPVSRANMGETGAVITDDPTGETIISGFAPVPGTGWGVITQEEWSNVSGPIQDSTGCFWDYWCWEASCPPG